MKTFKAIWKWLRVFLFIVIFLACAALCLPCAILISQGNLTIAYVYLAVFTIGFFIQYLEHRAGWTDDRFEWKNED